MDKIQVLIDNGFITLNEVLLYAYNHNALEDLNNQADEEDYYDQMISKYGIDDRQDELDRIEREALDDPQQYYEPEYNTDYVIASTSELMEETMVFPANKEGEIVSYSDLVCISARNGNDNWQDSFAAVFPLNTDEYVYAHVKTIHTERSNVHALFKKVKVADNLVI